MNLKKELLRITSKFFDETSNYSSALKEYKQLLFRISNEAINNEEHRNNVQLENGVAIGTLWAANCLDDLERTLKFIKGIDIAIQEKIHQKDSLHILYAGTGPFASLILPFVLKYADFNITYSFLEINPLSFEILKSTIKKLDLENHNINFINQDATKYQFPKNFSPDIIISETMQRALDSEQQVSVFYNLMRQSNSDTAFIPEKITLAIGTSSYKNDEPSIQQKYYREHHKVFEVSKKALNSGEWLFEKKSNKLGFTEKRTILRKKELSTASEIVVMTEITIYKNEKLIINESGLTVPKYIQNVSNNKKESLTIKSKYVIGSEPKLELKIV
ncbi:hypothetical protein Q4517_04210 [Tenacibaculum sp. 1_MG-2023]|uniref:hypothetical protein n=1 Tax=Tenacibaculum sp. 1_MG-2023 TaxID=3062653 RepID=UPI0026E4474C|nr:hypothetical protein [Tenacibaculum sp. 1_MG-2023]MDO6674749.1 hypothetical protein [Tenacibaculum sp. 1_MG-2023]